MTRLRPIVVPIAALTLATATPAAHAQPRRSVELDNPHNLAAKHADLPPPAIAAKPASSLLHAVLDPLGEAAVPDGRSAVAASPAVASAPGRPTPHSARGPPL
jgi:hypothetical protein